MSASTNLPLAAELLIIGEAMRRGDRPTAHQLAVQLTDDEPANEQAWLWRAATSDLLEERIGAFTHVLLLNPHSAAAQEKLQASMLELLQRDPYLLYDSETDDLYRVLTRSRAALVYPKGRSLPEIFPPATPPPYRAAYRWLGWSLIGLIPAGLGTLICAPLAVLAARKYLRQHPSAAARTRAEIISISATSLWLLAACLVLLLILHL